MVIWWYVCPMPMACCCCLSCKSGAKTIFLKIDTFYVNFKTEEKLILGKLNNYDHWILKDDPIIRIITYSNYNNTPHLFSHPKHRMYLYTKVSKSNNEASAKILKAELWFQKEEKKEDWVGQRQVLHRDSICSSWAKESTFSKHFLSSSEFYTHNSR